MNPKLIHKQQLFINRTSEILGITHLEATRLLQLPLSSAIRVNPLQWRHGNPQQEFVRQGWCTSLLSWAPHCFALATAKEAVSHSDLFTDGEIYLQNASSFLPVIALDPRPGERILDMCAAPGGKTSHIAAITDNQAELWVNDNSRPRLARLRQNLDRLGVQVHSTTLFTVERLARELPLVYFDKILLDAPCSGEGLLRLDKPKDFTYWSLAQIKRLSKLQKRAIMSAWQLLKPGGTLVYSTCTMAPEENEGVVDYLLRRQPTAKVQPLLLPVPRLQKPLAQWHEKTFHSPVHNCARIAPGNDMEAFFVARIDKPLTAD